MEPWAANVLDMSGWLTVMELDDQPDLPAAAPMKHTSLAGLAVGNGISKYTLHTLDLVKKHTPPGRL